MSNIVFTATLLLSNLPRRPLETFFQTPPTNPLTIQAHTSIGPEILLSFADLCKAHGISYHASMRLDNADPPRKLDCQIFDHSQGENVGLLKVSQGLREFEYIHNVDVALQPSNVYRKHKRLVVFDMDSTLIQQEVIDEIAAFVGVKPQVAEITERAMRGELDFSASLRSRCALLNGVPSTVFETLKTNGTITFSPGAHELCAALKRLGCKLAVLSGGFQPLAEWVKDTLALDYAYANTLGVSEDGATLNGEVLGEIVNAERKAALLKEIAEKEGIDLRQVVAIGDGANDLVMMREAGFGVAFNAKPKVQVEAPSHINTSTLQDILYIFGFNESEQDQLLNPQKYVSKL